MAESLVVTSKVKGIVKDAGLRTSGGFITGLSDRVNQIVTAAIEKVKAEGKKKTLQLEDL